MSKPTALWIKKSLVPGSFRQGNLQPPNLSQCGFCQAAALTICLACSSRKLSPPCFLCAGNGGTRTKPSDALLNLVVMRLLQLLLVEQPFKVWLLPFLAMLALGLGSLRGWQKNVGAVDVLLGEWETGGNLLGAERFGL